MIHSYLRQTGLEHIAKQIMPLAMKCIRLATIPADEGDIPIGTSKIGGLPDLPAGTKWPLWKNIPLSFLCQINLHDLHRYQCCNELPVSGWLYFFYNAEQKTWGFDPQDIGSWKVIYYNGHEKDLTRYKPIDIQEDEKEYLIYEPCQVSFYEAVSMPGKNGDLIDQIIMDDELDSYIDFIEKLSQEYPYETEHQLLGHSNPIQGNMRLECQLVTNGIYCGDCSGYQDQRRKILESGTKDWRLLLQIDSDDNPDMMWGDLGKLYFWIRQQDLYNNDFDKVWMILQCS